MRGHKRLFNKLEKFIKDKSHAKHPSEWPEVMQKDLEDLHDIFYKIIDAKWNRDCDGDSPIRFKITDRTKYEPDFYSPLPYKTKENVIEYLRTASSNVGIAQYRFDIAWSCFQKGLKYEDKE